MKPANDPFFIFYDSRSGSTLLARLMSDHMDLFIPPEARFLPEALARPLGWWPPRRRRRFLHILEKDEKFSDWDVDLEKLLQALRKSHAISRRAMIAEVLRQASMGSGESLALGHFGFKKGEYQYKDREILSVFPDAHFICLVRDGRAVLNSKLKTIDSHGEMREPEPEINAGKWIQCLDNFERLRRERPDRVIVVHYEKVIQETRATLTAISERLGIPLGTPKSGKYEVPDRYGTMHSNVDKAPIADRIDSWKTELATDDIRRYEAVAAEHLLRHGYTLLYPQDRDAGEIPPVSQ